MMKSKTKSPHFILFTNFSLYLSHCGCHLFVLIETVFIIQQKWFRKIDSCSALQGGGDHIKKKQAYFPTYHIAYFSVSLCVFVCLWSENGS